VADARARAAYLGYRAAAEAARVLPPALARPLARTTGRAWRLTQPNRRHQVARNLARVLPDAPRAERHQAQERVFDYYARYWHELFRLAVEDPAPLLADFTCEGLEHLETAAAVGRGVVLALPHLGNWDLAGAWLAEKGYQISVVAELAEPPELFEWFVETRARLGMRVIALGPDAGGVLLRELRDQRVVCLLCDRDLTGDGITVTFFDEKTRLPGGPAMLALRTGAPLLPVGLSFRPHDGHAARILEPIPAERLGRLRDDVTRVTQQLADRFEELIRATPDQWLMLQPNWPSDVLTHP
jgi:phosphatidylinositol dimannoside acyltransferase